MQKECYKDKILKKYNLSPLGVPLEDPDDDGEWVVACTKMSYEKIVKQLKKQQAAVDKTTYLCWYEDGPNSPDDKEQLREILTTPSL